MLIEKLGLVGVIRPDEHSDLNAIAESNLDLMYLMGLVGKRQPVTLYQVGDLEQGAWTFRCESVRSEGLTHVFRRIIR